MSDVPASSGQSNSDSPRNRGGVTLEFCHVLCLKHGEPFRLTWPQGYALISVHGFQNLMQTQQFQDEISRAIPAGLELSEDQQRIAFGKAVEQLLIARPICCRLEKSELLAIYLEAEVGITDKCDLCGKVEKGTPYRLTNFWGRVKQHSHICFDCVLNRVATTSMKASILGVGI